MRTPRFITQAIRGWMRWRSQQKLYAAYPELRQIDIAHAEARRKHQPTKHFEKAKEAFIRSALREHPNTRI